MKFDKEFDKLKGDYTDFLNEIKRIVIKLLQRNNIPIAFDISARLKDLDSIEEKNTSGRFKIESSITELNDLVGLRIVLLFPEFKDNVINLLRGEFKSLNRKNEETPPIDKFGYSSVHLVLGIKDEWVSSPDWKGHSGKKIEIQIRTLSEHIWAETSHSLFYKREENVPRIITRDLYRLSALLEVVDEKLQSIKNNVEAHYKYIASCPYNEILELDLNSETFRRVLKHNSRDLYMLNDNENRELSARIEHDYNILTTKILDQFIAGNIDPKDLDERKYISSIINLLDANKLLIDEQQKDQNINLI